MLNQSTIHTLSEANRIIIAYSGGIDSHVLLQLVANDPELQQIKKIAVHIHHGLSPNADDWSEHCEMVCNDLSIDYQSIVVAVDSDNGQSPEAAAREARYQALRSIMQTDDILLTAHHQDDQAETLLLQLFRGAGIKGLAAMPEQTDFSNGSLVRPLLNSSRTDIEAYAKQHKLNWIEDESNAEINFDRNYLRHEIMPLLTKRWPAVAQNITRSAKHCAEADMTLKELTQQLFQFNNNSLVKPYDQFVQGMLDTTLVQQYPRNQQKLIVRSWLQQCDLPLPSTAQLNAVLDEVIAAKEDAEPLVEWQGAQIRRYQSQLYAMQPLPTMDISQVYAWPNVNEPLHLPYMTLDDSLLANAELNNVSVRFRQGGERFHPFNRDKSQTLKKLMQEWQIPSFLRDYVPLIYVDEKLTAVVGYATC
tara:strand:- start:42988 stop:44244 length:1257 start_codon:yes stop_codon:yes gene_type:complete